jgi:hypothetical protein
MRTNEDRGGMMDLIPDLSDDEVEQIRCVS